MRALFSVKQAERHISWRFNARVLARPVRTVVARERPRLISVHASAPGRVAQADLVKFIAGEQLAVLVNVAGAHGKPLRTVAAPIRVRCLVD